MMFVNVSPVMWNVSETLCSLRFAKRCASVQLGQAKKSSESVAHLKAIIGAVACVPRAMVCFSRRGVVCDWYVCMCARARAADLEKAISSRSRRG